MKYFEFKKREKSNYISFDYIFDIDTKDGNKFEFGTPCDLNWGYTLNGNEAIEMLEEAIRWVKDEMENKTEQVQE